MTTPALGDLIRRRRTDLNLSQTDLADRVGKSQRWVSNLETHGIAQPRLLTLRTLARALNLDVADLVLAAGYSESAAQAERLARETAAFEVDPTTPEGRLVPLIRRVDWDARPGRLEEMEAEFRFMIQLDKERREREAKP